MLIESDTIFAVLGEALERAREIYENTGRAGYDAGRYEGLKEAIQLVDRLVSQKGR